MKLLRELEEALSYVKEVEEKLKFIKHILEPKRVHKEAKEKALQELITALFRISKAREILQHIFLSYYMSPYEWEE